MLAHNFRFTPPRFCLLSKPPRNARGLGGQVRDCRETLTEVAHGEPVRCVAVLRYSIWRGNPQDLDDYARHCPPQVEHSRVGNPSLARLLTASNSLKKHHPPSWLLPVPYSLCFLRDWYKLNFFVPQVHNSVLFASIKNEERF
ncbi:hypothetical protein SD80_032410 [Scytonema tolypothrichoides VB-61278]|nr:hypothetical protein SD80_032410 [Scytonema tolypothrichoides VB-61278]